MNTYAVYLALLVNAPAQAESIMHNPEHAAIGKGLYVNLEKKTD